MTSPITYQKSGVDPEKASAILSNFSRFLKSRPQDPSLIAGIGPFASCYRLNSTLAKMEDPILVTSCDGVGTKLKLALDWNDLSGLGRDLVAMNVNDILCAGAKPLFFLDYYSCGKLDDTQLTTLLKSIQEGCEEAEMVLAGGETAEMPGIYSGSHFDLAGFVVGMSDGKQLLGPAQVKVGDLILGLRSSGFHSNGYSLVRKIVASEKLQPNDVAPFAPESWKSLLLKPTIIYSRQLGQIMDKLHAAAHITGGGLFENLPRILPAGTEARINSSAWTIPKLFSWFQDKAGISTEQLLSTFNCGMGMLLVLPPSNVSSVRSHLETEGVETVEVGVVAPSTLANPLVLWR